VLRRKRASRPATRVNGPLPPLTGRQSARLHSGESQCYADCSLFQWCAMKFALIPRENHSGNVSSGLVTIVKRPRTVRMSLRRFCRFLHVGMRVIPASVYSRRSQHMEQSAGSWSATAFAVIAYIGQRLKRYLFERIWVHLIRAIQMNSLLSA